jgi:hypothetical protein
MDHGATRAAEGEKLMPSAEWMQKVMGEAIPVEEADGGAVEEDEQVEAPEEEAPQEDEAVELAEEEPEEEQAEEGDEEPADEPEEETVAAQAPEDNPEDYFLYINETQKYKTREDAEKGLRETRRWSEDTGRINNELREALEQAAQREEELARQIAYMQGRTDAAPLDPGISEWMDSAVETDPRAGLEQIVQYASARNNTQLVYDYLRRWGQVDPYSALDAKTNLDRFVEQQQAYAGYEEPQYQPESPHEMWKGVWEEMCSEDPSLRDEEQGVTAVIKSDRGLFERIFQSGDPLAVERGLRQATMVHRVSAARVGNPSSPRRTKSSNAAQAQQEKLAATVSTGDGAPARGKSSSPDGVPEELQGMMAHFRRMDQVKEGY